MRNQRLNPDEWEHKKKMFCISKYSENAVDNDGSQILRRFFGRLKKKMKKTNCIDRCTCNQEGIENNKIAF